MDVSRATSGGAVPKGVNRNWCESIYIYTCIYIAYSFSLVSPHHTWGVDEKRGQTAPSSSCWKSAGGPPALWISTRSSSTFGRHVKWKGGCFWWENPRWTKPKVNIQRDVEKKHALNRTMIYWCVNSISKRLPEGTSNCCELGIRDLSELRVIKASEFLGGTSNHQHEIECDFWRMDIDTHSWGI